MVKNERWTYLDLLRGLCALAVLIVHFRFFYQVAPDVYPDGFTPAQMPLWHVLAPVYLFGGMAVQMFWILSGFVFMHVYGDGATGPGKFAMWRVSRLYPLHLLTLALVALLQPAAGNLFYTFNDGYHFALNLLFASGWGFEHGGSFNGPVATVSAEIPIYALFYLLSRAGTITPKSAVGLSIAFLAAYFATRSMVLYCGAFFFSGVGLYWLVTQASRRAILIFAAASVAIGAISGLMLLASSVEGSPLLPLVAYVLLPGPFALFGLMDRNSTVPQRFHWIGEITYSTYLLHVPIMLVLMMVMRATGTTPGLWLLALFPALTIALACVCFRYFEMPAQRWIRRIYAHPRPSASQPEELRSH